MGLLSYKKISNNDQSFQSLKDIKNSLQINMMQPQEDDSIDYDDISDDDSIDLENEVEEGVALRNNPSPISSTKPFDCNSTTGLLGLQVVNRGSLEQSMMALPVISIIDVKQDTILRHINGNKTKKYTMYTVHIENSCSGRSWVVRRRYSDFLLFRRKLLDHLEECMAFLPEVYTTISALYFPKKHKFRSFDTKVIYHRCLSFLEYVRTVHSVMIDPGYLSHKNIAVIGHSIIRGFLGSSCVLDVNHQEYVCPKPIAQHELDPTKRACVTTCGALVTVPENFPLGGAEETIESDEDYGLEEKYFSKQKRSKRKKMKHSLKKLAKIAIPGSYKSDESVVVA